MLRGTTDGTMVVALAAACCRPLGRVFFVVNERRTPLGSRERRVSIEDSISIANWRLVVFSEIGWTEYECDCEHSELAFLWFCRSQRLFYVVVLLAVGQERGRRSDQNIQNHGN